MPRWGLIVEETCGYRDRRWDGTLLGTVEGTRDEALTKLLQWAKTYQAAHPRIPKQRTVYRTTEGYVVFVRGATETFHLRFTAAELVHDSDAPEKTLPEHPPHAPAEGDRPARTPPGDAARERIADRLRKRPDRSGTDEASRG